MSRSEKDFPTDKAAPFAQSCHFFRSEEEAENRGGLKKIGVWGFIEGGADKFGEQEIGRRKLALRVRKQVAEKAEEHNFA